MIDIKFIVFIFCWTSLVFCSCGTHKKPYYSDEAISWSAISQPENKQMVHSLYLIGDSGEVDDHEKNNNYVLQAARAMLEKEVVETSLVILGDNVYPVGLPSATDPERKKGEAILDAQLKLAMAHKGATYVIPGNHDWNKHMPGGRDAILRQEEHVKKFSQENKEVKFYPTNACGDPEVVQVNKNLVYIFLDTQWWLQDWSNEKNMNQYCAINSREELLVRLEEIFKEYLSQEIVVMHHHPIKSNGKHGGNFSIKQHIFPLTDLNKYLYIPLPIIGSIYPIYRSSGGSKQDITNATNKELMQGMDRIAKKLNANVIFASGHDHGMQFFQNEQIKYIVSGGASKVDYIRKGKEATYAREARGFAKVNFYENNESWLEIYTVSGFDVPPLLEFRSQLRAPNNKQMD